MFAKDNPFRPALILALALLLMTLLRGVVGCAHLQPFLSPLADVACGAGYAVCESYAGGVGDPVGREAALLGCRTAHEGCLLGFDALGRLATTGATEPCGEFSESAGGVEAFEACVAGSVDPGPDKVGSPANSQ